MTNDLIHEVEESMRQERIEKLWKEYGPTLVFSAILAVLLTGALSGWRSWNDRVNSTQTASFVRATEADDMTKALTDAAASMRPGQKGLALLMAAGDLLHKEGKEADALEICRKAAGDVSLPEELRDFAVLQSVRLDWSLNPKTADAAALVKRADVLAANVKSPWRWHASLQAAQIAMRGLGDAAAAQSRLEAIMQSPDAPAAVKERASVLQHIYGGRPAASDNPEG